MGGATTPASGDDQEADADLDAPYDYSKITTITHVEAPGKSARRKRRRRRWAADPDNRREFGERPVSSDPVKLYEPGAQMGDAEMRASWGFQASAKLSGTLEDHILRWLRALRHPGDPADVSREVMRPVGAVVAVLSKFRALGLAVESRGMWSVTERGQGRKVPESDPLKG